MSAPIRLESLAACFEGLVPATIATCSRDGIPNVSKLSQVTYVDSRHVAVSFQFFNKTRQNIEENPYAKLQVFDPRNLNAYRLMLKYARSETSGPLFETMALQLDAIASYGGMGEVFSLKASDVYEVLEIQRVPGMTRAPELPPPAGALFPPADVGALHVISERIARAKHLSELFETVLSLLERFFGHGHSMILVNEEACSKLVTVASRGYAENGAGSEVALGDGLIGLAAKARRPLCLEGLAHRLRYARAVRGELERSGRGAELRPEIPLPGLAGAASQFALPLLSQGRLLGVLALESPKHTDFSLQERPVLGVVANQLAGAMAHLQEDAGSPAEAAPAPAPAKPRDAKARKFCFYSDDDCVFVDGEYLIRNVPGRILWRILKQHAKDGRTDFSNRELRMDSWIGLPELKDNLESRLILLRNRLEQRCPGVSLVQTGRGKFSLQLSGAIELSEQTSPAPAKP